MSIDFAMIVPKFDALVGRGFSVGLGSREGQMCIEAAICAALDEPHGDSPSCVTASVRQYKITLNDSPWSSPMARAKGLRDLGIAQLGSAGVVSDVDFTTILQRKTIQQLIPHLFRLIFTNTSNPHHVKCLEVADRCATNPTPQRAREAAWVAGAAGAARVAGAVGAAEAAWAARVAGAAWAAWAAEAAEAAGANTFLHLSAALALETLCELGSPGCVYLDNEKASTDQR